MSKKDMSKKERKALEAREAELAAELARREKKAAKKGKKLKGKKLAKANAETMLKAGKKAKKKSKTPTPMTAEERQALSPSAKATVEAAADAALATPSSDGAKIAAATAKAAAAEAGPDESVDAVKMRVQKKRQRRAELVAAFDSIDRDDEVAVAAYNAELASLGGGKFVSSNATKAANDERLTDVPKKTRKATEKKLVAEEPEPATQTVEPVETEKGTVYQAGVEGMSPDDARPIVGEDSPEADDPRAGYDFDGANVPTDDDFAKPSEAPKVDFEQNGNGQYKVQRPSDGKLVGYTRTTTYIDNLEDKTKLTEWKMRVLLEGVAINDTPDERGEFSDDPIVGKVRDLIHNRDVAIAKAHRRDKKGKLSVGELATYVEGAWSDFKKALNALAEELLELGGAHVKAQKGTDIHALTEVFDREGLDAIDALLVEGKITPADFADVIAYRDALERAGIKIDRENIERVIVNDELKVAGRLDRTGLVKFPGAARAVRCVIDIKTGRIDYGAGKIAQQLTMYATSQGYDLNTHERTDLKLSRTKAVVVHLPAGSGTATVRPVDLTLGARGNKLSGEVRAWRNEGKKAIDFACDLAAPERQGDAS